MTFQDFLIKAGANHNITSDQFTFNGVVFNFDSSTLDGDTFFNVKFSQHDIDLHIITVPQSSFDVHSMMVTFQFKMTNAIKNLLG